MHSIYLTFFLSLSLRDSAANLGLWSPTTADMAVVVVVVV